MNSNYFKNKKAAMWLLLNKWLEVRLNLNLPHCTSSLPHCAPTLLTVVELLLTHSVECITILAPEVGFEPTTFRFRGDCSTK